MNSEIRERRWLDGGVAKMDSESNGGKEIMG